MRIKILKWLKNIIAAVVLALCGLAFFKHDYPLKIFDLQFTALLQNTLLTKTTFALILLFTLIVITLLFGRIYCAILCPLGIYQEFITFLFKPLFKKHKSVLRSPTIFTYIFATFLFGMLLGSSVIILRYVDPYSIAGNALSGAYYGIGFIIALTILVFFKKRFFCTDICPVGTLLGLLAKFSLFQIRFDDTKCKNCGLCIPPCPTGSIDYKNHSVNNQTCIKCLNCITRCQHDALYYGLKRIKTTPPPFSPKRRQLIISGLLLLSLGAAYKSGLHLSKKIISKIKDVILPPGADCMQSFSNRCLNCNLCVQNCPAKIIKPATAEIPVVHIEYGKSHCHYTCCKCSAICPSGALKKLNLKQKQQTKIATAEIDNNLCIQCGSCVRECPKKIITQKPDDFPSINSNKCIGCGVCANVCPTKAIKINTIEKQKILS